MILQISELFASLGNRNSHHDLHLQCLALWKTFCFSYILLIASVAWDQINNIWAAACDFQQSGILTSVDSDEPVQPPFKLRISKWCSVSSLTLIEYSSHEQRLWSDCAYAKADLRLCWSHIPHCWKSCVAAHFLLINLVKKGDKIQWKVLIPPLW